MVIIETEQSIVERARDAGFNVRHADSTDTEELASAGAERAKLVVAATGDDDSNLLVAQLSRSKFGIEAIDWCHPDD